MVQLGGVKNSRAMPSGSWKLRPGAVGRVLDGAVFDTELVQALCPLLKLVAGGAAERDMVETDAELAERLAERWLLMLVQPEQGAVAHDVHGVVEVRVGVLVDHRVGVEERAVPGGADREVVDGERNVGERGNSVMSQFLPVRGCRSTYPCDPTERP